MLIIGSTRTVRAANHVLVFSIRAMFEARGVFVWKAFLTHFSPMRRRFYRNRVLYLVRLRCAEPHCTFGSM